MVALFLFFGYEAQAFDSLYLPRPLYFFEVPSFRHSRYHLLPATQEQVGGLNAGTLVPFRLKCRT